MAKYFIPPSPGSGTVPPLLGCGGMKSPDAQPVRGVTPLAFRCQGWQVPPCVGEVVDGWAFHGRECAFWWSAEGLRHWPFSPLRSGAKLAKYPARKGRGV